MTKEKRRQYGTGSVSQRKSDGRWIGAIMAGYTPEGKRRRITVTAATEAECKRKIERLKGDIARNGIPVSGSTRTNVKTWAERWLEITQAQVRPKTWAANRGAVRQHIVPAIGNRRLDQLTPDDMRRVTDAVLAERSHATAVRTRAVLVKMLKDAKAEGHHVPDAPLLTKGIGKPTSDRDAIPPADAQALLAVAAGQPDGSRWVAAFLQGMRQAECLGLTWQCVDLDRRVIDVSWQLQALPYRSGRAGELRIPTGYEYRQLDGGLSLVRPKTSAGKRIIPIVPWMHSALTAWKAAAPTSPHDLVWPQDDGQPRRPVRDTKAWHALQDMAQVARVDGTVGRRYLLHECRHSCATMLMEAGVDEHVRVAILGHSSIASTVGYQHVSEALARQALESVAARLDLVGELPG